MSTEILKQRIKPLYSTKSEGKCVFYVMSRDQRMNYNHALLAAQKHALAKKLPLAVVFHLHERMGHRAREHYEWMLAGLTELEDELAKKDIPLLVTIGDHAERIQGLIKHTEPDAIYFDFNPLRGPTKQQEMVASFAACSVFVVDTHNILPVWVASDKLEIAARTLRPKIHRQLEQYLRAPEPIQKHPYRWPGKVMKLAELDARVKAVVAKQSSNNQHNLRELYPTGRTAAEKVLASFIDKKLLDYAEDRNDPSKDALSGLSPYLHFGQLSALEVVQAVQDAVNSDSGMQPSADSFIEELVVRKELSDNWCYYNHLYDSFDGAPEWARLTLQKHATDPREFLYSKDEFESAKTHDEAWNAAQRQLTRTGKIHGYMRMYWAKKVLEWSESPERAIKTLIYLNDFYHIDGGDPNGYVGIMWSVAGVHDRPWGERPVYGTVRSMVYGGLKRKFDIDAYIEQNR